jgi:hypothetical protein
LLDARRDNCLDKREKIHTVLGGKKYPKNNRFRKAHGLCLRSKQWLSVLIIAAAPEGVRSLLKIRILTPPRSPALSEFRLVLQSLAPTPKKLARVSVTIE